METVVLVASCESYRTGDFVTAARNARTRLVIATDAPSPFIDPSDTVVVDLADVHSSAQSIADRVPDAAAVVAVDDQGVRTAAEATRILGLPANPQHAVEATRNKLTMRRLLAEAGVRQPRFEQVGTGELREAGTRVGFPIVVKPVSLSASRGVVRLDGPTRAEAVEAQVRRIIHDAGGDTSENLIVEQYVDGDEVVIEGIVHDGQLEVLAVIDKPVPLTGPYFEETMFATPSVLSADIQDACIGITRLALDAIGLEIGPVHAELRIDSDGRPWIVEIAARSIGGLCGRSLTFGLLGEPLESVVLGAALGRTVAAKDLATPAAGVLMIPIPATGVLSAIDGVDDARDVEYVTSIDLTVTPGSLVRAAPESDRYIGFIFANGPDPQAVTEALSRAAARIDVVVDGESVVSVGQSDATTLVDAAPD